MPKTIPKKLARDLAQLGEEVIKETAQQPVELAKTVGEQIGVMPKGWGEEEARLAPEAAREKEEERKKGLALARRRIEELKRKPEPKPKIPEEEREKEKQKMVEEAEKRREVPEVPTRKKRGSALLSLRVKKRRGTGEIKSGI